MSSLNAFTILKKGHNYLEVEVRIVHTDERHIIDGTNFALQIILELYEKIREQFIYKSNCCNFPFTQEEGNLLISNQYKSLLDDLLLKMRWREIPISKADYDEIQSSGNYVYQGQKLSSLGLQNDSYSASLDTEYDAFCEEADKHIQLVDVLETQNFPHWFDSLEAHLECEKVGYGFDDAVYALHNNDTDPAYRLRITVSPNSLFLLNHIIENSSWESSAYNFENYCEYYRSNKSAIYHCLQYSSNIKTPNENVLLQWWDSLSSDWQWVFKMNLHIQKHNLYTAIKDQFQGMMTLGLFEHSYSPEFIVKLKTAPITVSDLQNISRMKMLFASGCEIKDLSPLYLLKGLKLLELEANPIQNIDCLSNLLDLEDLTLVIYENRPDQQCICSLTKIRDLTLDPNNQVELNILANMPNLRTFYTVLDFEPEFSFLEKLTKLKKMVGFSPGLSPDTFSLFEKLRNKGVDIIWETAEDSL